MTGERWIRPADCIILEELTKKQALAHLPTLIRFCYDYVNNNEMNVTIESSEAKRFRCHIGGFYFSSGQLYISPDAGDFVEARTPRDKEDLIVFLLDCVISKAGHTKVTENPTLAPIYKAKEVSKTRKVDGVPVPGQGIIDYLQLPSEVVFGVVPEIRVEPVVDEPVVVEDEVANEPVAEVVGEAEKESIIVLVDDSDQDDDDFVDPIPEQSVATEKKRSRQTDGKKQPSYVLANVPVKHSGGKLLSKKYVDDRGLKDILKKYGLQTHNFNVYRVADNFYKSFELRMTNEVICAEISGKQYVGIRKKDLPEDFFLCKLRHGTIIQWWEPFLEFVHEYCMEAHYVLPLIVLPEEKQSRGKSCFLTKEGTVTFSPECKFIENDQKRNRFETVSQIFEFFYARKERKRDEEKFENKLFTQLCACYTRGSNGSLTCDFSKLQKTLQDYFYEQRASVQETMLSMDVQSALYQTIANYLRPSVVNDEIDFGVLPWSMIVHINKMIQEHKETTELPKASESPLKKLKTTNKSVQKPSKYKTKAVESSGKKRTADESAKRSGANRKKRSATNNVSKPFAKKPNPPAANVPENHEDLRQLAEQTLHNTDNALQELKDELRRMAGKVVERDHKSPSNNNAQDDVAKKHSLDPEVMQNLFDEQMANMESSDSSSVSEGNEEDPYFLERLALGDSCDGLESDTPLKEMYQSPTKKMK